MEARLLRNGAFKAYRFEYTNGVGPYTAFMHINSDEKKALSNISKELSISHQDIQQHPSIFHDGGLGFNLNGEYRLCACISIEKLINWFSGYVKILFNNGFVLYEYTLKRMIIGESGNQVFFGTDDVIRKTKIEEIPSYS